VPIEWIGGQAKWIAMLRRKEGMNGMDLA